MLFCVAVVPGDVLCAIPCCVLLHCGVLFCVAVVPSDAPGVSCAFSCCVLLHYDVLFCVAVVQVMRQVCRVPSLAVFCYITMCCFVLL